MQNKEQLKQLLVNEYLNRFLTFYISKTNSIIDAEDLSQKAACECLDAIDRVNEITNVNAYFWSVAHNTYKNYLSKKDNYILDDDYCKIQIVDSCLTEQSNEKEEMHNNIRKSLSILSGLYRKVLVYYYYHEFKIKDISSKLNISIDMVKFYLQKGKKKLKEIYYMNQMQGEKSFNPKDFSIYYSGIDFSKVNVWEVFRRKLPGQIALICFEKPKSVSEIALETGCSSCYIEEEVELLINAGVMKESVKGKYQTNFHILRKEELLIVDEMFNKMYCNYIPLLTKEFENNYELIKQTQIFKHNAANNQYKWIFADYVADMDRRNIYTSDSDYPKILSCGARGIVFGMEEETPTTSCGQTPTYLNDYILWARDLWKLNDNSVNQTLLRESRNAQTVIDVYNNIINESNEEIYTNLIKHNILVKQNDKLYSNIAYLNDDFKKIMTQINEKLNKVLEEDTKHIYDYLSKLVTKKLPSNLKEYAHGYTMTWMMFFAGNKIIEALLKYGFLTNDGNIQISYFTNK